MVWFEESADECDLLFMPTRGSGKTEVTTADTLYELLDDYFEQRNDVASLPIYKDIRHQEYRLMAEALFSSSKDRESHRDSGQEEVGSDEEEEVEDLGIERGDGESG